MTKQPSQSLIQEPRFLETWHHKLIPYFKVAQTEAKKSVCERRQYGALIALVPSPEIGSFVVANNSRVGTCCDGGCLRDLRSFLHGGNVEAGAEVHAETAALLSVSTLLSMTDLDPQFLLVGLEPKFLLFLLVGFDTKTGEELLGESVYPCHSCALQLKYVGFNTIYIRNRNADIEPVSISEVINYREAVWSNA